MTKHELAVARPFADRQQALFAVRIGKRAKLTAEVSVTSSGVLAIGVLVSSILLSTAFIVRATRR